MGMNNSFYLKSFSGKVMDVSGGQCANEAKVIQWKYNGGRNQIWIV
jgi:hypothetical protein